MLNKICKIKWKRLVKSRLGGSRPTQATKYLHFIFEEKSTVANFACDTLCENTQIYKYTNIRIHKYTNTQIFVFHLSGKIHRGGKSLCMRQPL